MSTTHTTRRLVNARILHEVADRFGRTHLTAVGGAWGKPEDALAAARKYAENTAAAKFHDYRVAGIEIVDVRTNEKWAVAL